MWRRSDNTSSAPQPFSVPVTNKFEGNDGNWSTFMINIGIPAGQNFRVLVSTASSITWVPSTAGCTASDPSDCPQLRGVEDFAGAKSLGYDPQGSQGSNSLSSSIGLYGLQLGTSTFPSVYGANYSGINASIYSDVEGLGPYSSTTPEIQNEAIAAIASKSLFMGSFGLNIVPNNFGTGDLATFLTQYANSTPGIPSTSYGYSAGASYRPGGFYGSLVLGGYDSSRFTPATHSYSLTSGNHSIALTVQSIVVDIQGNSHSATLDSSDFSHIFTASIDSTLPYLWLPRAVCDRFEAIFGLTYDNSTDLYTINNTAHQDNINTHPTITFKLAESPTSSNTTEIVLPYAAFDQQASWPIYPNATNYFPIRRSSTGVNILGRSFLQEAYLIVDYDRQNFSLPQATFPASAPSPNIVPILKPPIKTQSHTPSHSFRAGAIAGIVLGAVVPITVAVVAYFLIKRHRERKRQAVDNAPLDSNGVKLESLDGGSSGRYQTSHRRDFSDGRSELPSTPQDGPTPPAHGYYGTPSPDGGTIHAKIVSELATPEKDSVEYFGRRKTGPGERRINELEVKPEIHELPAEAFENGEASEKQPMDKGDSTVSEEKKESSGLEDVAPTEPAEGADLAEEASPTDQISLEEEYETPVNDRVGSFEKEHGE